MTKDKERYVSFAWNYWKVVWTVPSWCHWSFKDAAHLWRNIFGNSHVLPVFEPKAPTQSVMSLGFLFTSTYSMRPNTKGKFRGKHSICFANGAFLMGAIFFLLVFCFCCNKCWVGIDWKRASWVGRLVTRKNDRPYLKLDKESVQDIYRYILWCKYCEVLTLYKYKSW